MLKKEFEHPHPKVMISACLDFRACRYNGEKIRAPFVEKMKDFVDFITLCPEADIGMGIPRKPIRLVREEGMDYLYQPATGKDWSGPMRDYSDQQLNSLRQIDGFILKAKSPSCGPKGVKIYQDKEGVKSPLRGKGLFAQKIAERFPDTPRVDEGHLFNYELRETFLTQIFALANFRQINTPGDLVNFHSRYKLLFMGYNQAAMRRMGPIVAGHKGIPLNQRLSLYKEELLAVFSRPVKANAMINVLQHGLSGFKEQLKKEEKAYFLELVEDYRDERLPLSVPISILKGWAIQYQNHYLLSQAFLEPYPKELLEITDSGKGRNLK